MDIGTQLAREIFNPANSFEERCLNVFRFQYQHNKIYREYVNALGVNADLVYQTAQIPFLPIRFFKTHKVVSTNFEAATIFESSGTTETINSKHLVKDTAIYEQSFFSCFEDFYGDVSQWCVVGLLPAYLERSGSSLVYMVQQMIEKSNHEKSGFYLYDFEALSNTLKTLEQQQQKTLLIGVTFALLDFAALHPQPLQHTIVMETGGMKGRRKEMIRAEVHDLLRKSFSTTHIHSEYGMTELLSQAYSKGNGLFKTPHWMRVLLRDEDDPLTLKNTKKATERGLVNIIDLANIYSCSFIATDDLGIVHADGSFEITGRMDNSDLRGCSLLAL